MSIDQQNPNSQSNAEDDLPDWLRELRGMPAKSSQPSTPQPASQPAADDEDELPDWLKEVHAEEDDSSETSSFDLDDDDDDGDDMWQQILAEEDDSAETMVADDDSLFSEDEDVSVDKPIVSQADESDDGLDMWQQILAEEGLSLDDLPEERPTEAGDMSLKDYLATTADESAKNQAKAALGPAATPKPVEPPVEEEEPEPVALADVDEADDDDGLVVEDELPDWLREDQPVEAGSGSLAWLTDESINEEDEEELEATLTPEPRAAMEDDGIVVEDELPDWLREDQPVEAGSGSLAWLTDESISDEEEEDEVEATPRPEPTVAMEDDGIVVEDELPDWLREDQPVEAGSGSLAWLTDESISDEEDSEPQPAAVTAEDDFGDDLLDTDGLPDWLQVEEDEISETSPTEVVQAQTSSPAVEAETEDDGMVDMDGLPDWLREESDTDAREAPEQGVPAWLQDVSEEDEAEEPIAVEAEAEMPDWLRGAEETEDDLMAMESVAVDDLDVENLPDWLESSADETLEIEEDLIDINDVPAEGAAVPAWLEKLRQSDSTSDLEDEIEFEAAEPVSAEAVIEEFSEEEAVEAPEPLSMVTGDATAKLSVARATLNAGELDDALEIYRDLLEEPAAVSEIIASLTDVLDQYQDQPAVYELLGDAQMRDGQLNRALDAYRAALEKM